MPYIEAEGSGGIEVRPLEPEEYPLLTVKSRPYGVEFTINGAPFTTPAYLKLSPGDYTIIFPETFEDKPFIKWEDGSTDPVRTITVTEDATVVGYYKMPFPWKAVLIMFGLIAVAVTVTRRR